MRNTKIKTRDGIVIVIFFLLSFLLSYKECIVNNGDFRVHAQWSQSISMIIETSHGGWHLITWLFYKLLPLSSIYVAAALSTALFEAITVIAVFGILRHYVNNKWTCYMVSISLMVGPLYLRFFNECYYLGQGTPNIWHNPTAIAVRPLMLIITVVLIETWKERASNRGIKYIILSFLMLASVWIKPSFLMIFLPAYFLAVIYRLFFTKKISFKDCLKECLILAPSLLALLAQYVVLYGSSAGKDMTEEASGVAISFFTALGTFTDNVFLSLILLIAFPLCIMVFWYKDFWGDILARFVFLMFICGFAEAAVFIEEGIRARHGNFTWGYFLAGSFLWIISIGIFFKSLIRDCEKLKIRTNYMIKIKYVTAGILLLWHFVAGTAYYILLLTNENICL